jgi:pSer/pThr/pTyr-binding forkhead associated (FHA) protein
MAERKCSGCGAVAEPKLKFCRECGGLVDAPAAVDASEAPTGVVAPAPAAADPGSAMPGGGAAEPPTERSRLAGAGDETIISGLAAVKAAAAKPKPAADASLEKTQIHSGTIRTQADPPPPADDVEADLQKTFLGGSLDLSKAPPKTAPAPPPAPDIAADLQKTFLGTSLPGMAPAPRLAAPPAASVPKDAVPVPVPAPVPAPEPPRHPDEMTAHDDLAVGNDSGEIASEPPAPAPPRSAVHRPTAPIPGLPPAGPPGATIRLEHWSPRVKGDVVDIDSTKETLVGRDRGDLRYPEDAFLSKKHARFFRDGEGRLCVEDLGGLNGTFLRLTAPVKLEHRDVIIVGRHTFRFELLQYEEKDDRTLEGDPLTKVQGIQGVAPRARIVKRQDEGFRGLPYYFGTQRYVLGRTDGTHNFQRDDRLSRRHAALQYRDGDYWLEDLGSQNGTFLRLRGSRVLERGDVVMMGDQYFRLV